MYFNHILAGKFVCAYMDVFFRGGSTEGGGRWRQFNNGTPPLIENPHALDFVHVNVPVDLRPVIHGEIAVYARERGGSLRMNERAPYAFLSPSCGFIPV